MVSAIVYCRQIFFVELAHPQWYGKRKQIHSMNSNLLHSGMKFKRETKFNVTKRVKSCKSHVRNNVTFLNIHVSINVTNFGD